MPSFQLKILVGQRAGELVAINHDFFLIGRGFGCHLTPCSELISRHHCLLIRRFNGIILRDLESKNGTSVNGVRRADDVILVAGDRIEIGKLEFEFVVSQPTNAGPVLSGIANQDAQKVMRQLPHVESQKNPVIETSQSLNKPTFEIESEPECMSVTHQTGMILFKFADGCPCVSAFKRLRGIFSKTI